MAVLHSRAKVLIVDDDVATIRLIADALSREYDVLVAKTAREGLQQALNTQPNLILLDVVMPGIDGFALCRQLKSYDQIQKIPVIFVSALDAVDQQAIGVRARCSGLYHQARRDTDTACQSTNTYPAVQTNPAA